MRRLLHLCVATALVPAVVSCESGGDVVDAAQVKIVKELQGKFIYERGNLPEELDASTIMGYYDIVGGAYRYIVNEYVAKEERPDRGRALLIHPGDSISFYFDARIYNGSSFENSTTYYTNIDSRRAQLAGENADFDTEFESWPLDPLKIKVGDDPQILKSVQAALLSCRAATTIVDEDGKTVRIASDEVRVYLTPDIAFGGKTVYSVPANSTLVFAVTNIEKIIE